MGKLLTGRYGEEPQAESFDIPLKDCHGRLGMKPSDFVSEGPPKFFRKSFDAGSRYLVFLLTEAEAAGNPIWKAGYYLLPIEALDAYKSLRQSVSAVAGAKRLPVNIESKENIPPEVGQRALRWADQCQPLFFKCKCDHLELRMDPPWALRRRWRARLRCPDRCQPVLTEAIG